MSTRYRHHLLALLLYLLLALLMTWPLVTQLAGAIPGDGFDGWQNVWNLWWMREAWLVEHSSPYFTDLLHYPTGADIRFQTMAPFNGLTFLNVQTAIGLLPAYNAAVLFSFVLGGYGTYLLALYAMRRQRSPSPLTRHGAAFVAGIVFAFSPYHFAHLLGHLQLIVLQWIPFYVLFLVRGLDRAERRARASLPAARFPLRPWLADTAKAAFFLILVGLCDWYYVMYCLFFTGLLLLVRLLQRRLTWQGIALVAGTGGIFGVALAPLLLPMIRGAAAWTGTSLLRAYDETLNLSADLLAFVTPQVFHPLWGDWAAARSNAFTATVSEFTVFAGFTVLTLTLIAIIAMRNQARSVGIWLLGAGFFAVLALGPVLHVNGRTDLLPGGGQIPLPYDLLYKTVPFIKLSRSVSRMSVMVMLCLGVAAAFGLLALMEWLARRVPRSRKWLGLMPFAAAALVLFEFLPVPYPLSPPDTPAWYQELAAETGPGAVLNLPANWERPGYLLYQTTHGKPLSTGYLTRDDPTTLIERAPVLSQFRWLGPDIHTTEFDLSAQGLQVLHDLLGVRWVVLDRYKMPGGPEREQTTAFAEAIFDADGQAPSYEDDRLTVYQVVAPSQRGPYLILQPGWPPRERDDTGQVWRRLPTGTAAVTLVNPTAGPIAVEVLAALPAGATLSIVDDAGDTLATWQDGGQAQRYVIPPLVFAAGDHTLTLTVEGPPDAFATIYAIHARAAQAP